MQLALSCCLLAWVIEFLEQVHLLFVHTDFMIFVNAFYLQNCFGFRLLDTSYLALVNLIIQLLEV